MAASGKYVVAADLIARLNPTTYLAIFDDANSGDVNTVTDTAVQLVIDSGEAEAESWIITEQGIPLPVLSGNKPDRLMKHAALEYCVALSFERHPEYVRTFGENKRSDIWKRADERMKRLKDAVTMLPDVVQQTGKKPKNVGGIVYDSGPRTIVDSADGTSNGGDL